MVHSIEILSEGIVKNLSIEEYKQENTVCIAINDEFIVINKEDLHSFIGTLLHVQSKLRK